MLEQQGQWWEDLPEYVVEEIFYKLPVSSILSARAVCKSWKVRLDKYDFRKLYDLNCTKEKQWLLLTGTQETEGTVVSMYNTSLDRCFQVHFTWGGRVCGGAGGLLLLREKCRKFVVGNPISNDWKELPPLPLEGYARCMGMISDSANVNSYKVVVMVKCMGLVVYDSEEGTWSVKKKLGDDPIPWNFTHPVVCNGVIYAISWFTNLVIKYNVEMDEILLARVDARRPWLWDRPWVVPWKGNIYMFAGFTYEYFGVWVLHTNEWVLVSKSPSHHRKVRVHVLWLDGDIVKVFVSGSSSVLTYNLAVASWSTIKTRCAPPPVILPSVCMPLTFTAVP